MAKLSIVIAPQQKRSRVKGLIHSRRAAGAILAAAAFSLLGAVARADENARLYISNVPGVSVDYLLITESGHNESGYLETIRAPGAARDSTSSQTFGTGSGGSLTFGRYVATRANGGYTLMSVMPDGGLEQAAFIPTTLRTINSSIAILSASSKRSNSRLKHVSQKNELLSDNVLTTKGLAQLTTARAEETNADDNQRLARGTAEQLANVAREARASANAAVDESGVTPAQNQRRLDLLQTADDAERDAGRSQGLAIVEDGAAVNARAYVVGLQLHLAYVAARARALAIDIRGEE